LGGPTHTFDIVDVTGRDKDYTILIEGVVTRLREKGIKIGTMFLDREFFNLAVILALFSMGVDFIMAARINKRIKRVLEEHKRETSFTPAILKYRFKDKRSPEFYLVAIPNPDYAKDKNNGEFLLFATSINFDTVQKQLSAGVPFTAIAASQKVSEGTLRRRLRGEELSRFHS
jgi:hypothetical protein